MEDFTFFNRPTMIWNLGFGIWDLGFGIWDLKINLQIILEPESETKEPLGCS
jgi:hypothetical protein